MNNLETSSDTIDLINLVPSTFLQLSIYDRIVYSPSIRSYINSSSEETFYPMITVAALTGLVFAANRARKAAELAQSWRNFKVGATAIMLNPSTASIGYLDRYNVKPSKENNLNLHAEQVAMAKGRKNNLNKLVGIAIYADPTDEDPNPNNLPTLRPCSRCIAMMKNNSEVDKHTLVLGANPDLSLCELYAFGMLTGNETTSLNLPAFSLKNTIDLDIYDKEIQPKAISRIFKLSGFR